MTPPLIGITTHAPDAPDRADLDRLLHNIVRGVERAGGLPALIPPALDPATAQSLYQRLDGLLLAGGGDVDPALYGADGHPAVDGVDSARDWIEVALARQAVRESRPLFGICRGAQILNVALGGTLYRAIEEHPGAQRHTYFPGLPYDYLAHPVQVQEDSTLARIVGQPVLMVNSLHHQACNLVAPGLRVVAAAPDGMVEAVEIVDHPFGLAVQWHPEGLPDDPAMQGLFQAFVRACQYRR